MGFQVRGSRWLPLALVALAACGEERPPVSYVQPNVLEKSFFVGEDLQNTADDPEFWARASLIDVGYGADQTGLFTSTWAQKMSRIKWSIQEELLLARLAYERIESSDGKGVGGPTNDGIVVAAFAITSHFDIQRRYNPATGERSNVVEENTSDRPWYARRYMRVDWSQNLATETYDFDTLSLLGLVGVRYVPMAYYVNDPNSDDAPHFAPEEGYFDVTTKVYAVPERIDLSRYGGGRDLPACAFDQALGGGTQPVGNCNTTELTVRHSFRRVVDRDYEPADWDGIRFKAFGAFTTERFGYARMYGMTDDRHRYLINRYNLWERSHSYKDPETMTGPVECYTPDSTPPGSDPDRDLAHVALDGAGLPLRDGAGRLVLENGPDGTADECQEVTYRTGLGGSRCDSLTQKCTLPYRSRTPAPQVWYFATGSHPEYFEPTALAANEWDVALRSAVMAARYAECQRAGDQAACGDLYPAWRGQMDDAADAVALAREVDDCRHGKAYAGQNCDVLADELGGRRGYQPGVIAVAKMPELVVLCHSPVEADDPAACGEPRLPADLTAADCYRATEAGDLDTMAVCRTAKNARPGDLRYHLVYAIPTPQTGSPWGIMADASDPLTGEKVAASINVWTAGTDSWAQRTIDLARYIAGELDTSEVTEGTYIADWSKAAEAATRHGALAPLTADALNARLAAGVGMDAAALEGAKTRFANAAGTRLVGKVAETARALETVRAGTNAAATMPVVYRTRRQKAQNTPVETALTTRMMQEYAGVGGLDSALALDLASPLRDADPTVARGLRQLTEDAIAAHGGCVLGEAQAPLAIADLTKHLEAKFGAFDRNSPKAEQLARAERMRRYLAQKVHYSVVSHEMGHSVGLRHNFVASADAFGYRPQYWQLRTKNGTLSARCQTPGTDTEGLQPDGACVGPRYFDPITEEERENLIWMFMQGSTMDYPGESTQDLLGLGVYDFAAARMFYGQTLSVFADDSFKKDRPRGQGMLDKLDNFGGTLGLKPRIGDGEGGLTTLHYSDYQREYELITDCDPVHVEDFKPATWNEDRDGAWSPLLDGLLVEVDGSYSRCRQQPVDYVAYDAMKSLGRDAYGEVLGKTHDAAGRVRVAYGFATDHWADHGNISVYRHDNGADPYELFDFLITQQEVGHIFSNYRRGRVTFTVRGAFSSSLTYYNEKMRDGAKGLALAANVYRDLAFENHYDYNMFWAAVAPRWFRDNLLASTIAFDHFTRMLQRPEAGPHFLPTMGDSPLDPPVPDGVWRSAFDAYNAPDNVEENPKLVVPNGATGRYGNVSWGGRPVENRMADDHGDYNTDYTVNAGSYYEKAFTATLLTESVDNFVSDSRNDFIDPRYRSVSLADLFPDGYRRWLANNLTGDDAVKGPRIAARTGAGGRLVPEVDASKYPVGGIGWTSWTPVGGPEACFNHDQSLACTTAPANTVVLDPQVGWEQQKFLIAWTLQYLPENQQQTWLNQMYLWEIGADTDPGFDNRIELHDPNGRIYVAKTFGKETVFGKRVQKGVSARVLEYANELLAAAYRTIPGPDLDGDDAPDWYEPELGEYGQPIVRYDPTMLGDETTTAHCNATDDSGCTCEANAACIKLQRYLEVPFFLRQAMDAYDLADPSMRGVY